MSLKALFPGPAESETVGNVEADARRCRGARRGATAAVGDLRDFQNHAVVVLREHRGRMGDLLRGARRHDIAGARVLAAEACLLSFRPSLFSRQVCDLTTRRARSLTSDHTSRSVH
jgi:hypothetical protein